MECADSNRSAKLRVSGLAQTQTRTCEEDKHRRADVVWVTLPEGVWLHEENLSYSCESVTNQFSFTSNIYSSVTDAFRTKLFSTIFSVGYHYCSD